MRWGICALLFFGTTINYVDRQVLSILKPVLQGEFQWKEADYAWIVVAFQLAYAMMPLTGRVIDRLGARLAYAVAVGIWSAAAVAQAFARSTLQFWVARFTLGVGESGNFPAAVRTVAEWFPKEERSFATGIFNSGSNIGVILAAVVVPFLTLRFGWQSAFLVTGAMGFLWLAPWLIWSRSARSSLSRANDEPAPPYREILQRRPSWAFVVGKFVTDPVWWFYISWIPGFLSTTYGVDLTTIGPPLITIYLAADAGSIAGGWLYKGFARRGWSANASRKTAMLICAASATPVVLLLWVETLWPAVALLGLAAAAHQGWSANLFTMVSDTTPRHSVGSVVGLGGLAGSVSGMLISPAVGYWLDFSGGAYRPLFVFAGLAYLIALGLIQLVVPRMREEI